MTELQPNRQQRRYLEKQKRKFKGKKPAPAPAHVKKAVMDYHIKKAVAKSIEDKADEVDEFIEAVKDKKRKGENNE